MNAIFTTLWTATRVGGNRKRLRKPINIHSHFETERRTRLLNQWRSDGIDARWRDNGVDVHAESLASLLKVAWHESGRRNTNTPAGYTEAIAEPWLFV